MAIVEIQFRQDVFFAILAAQIVRTPLPANLLSMLPAGRLIERVDVGLIDFAGPDLVLFGDGELAFKIPVTVHHTSYADARAAGSLQPPVTQAVPCTVWIRLQAIAPDPLQPGSQTQLRFTLARVEVLGQFVPTIAPPGSLPLGDLGIPISDIALVAENGVVAIRLATPSGGALLAPLANRLGIDQWGQFVEGQVFADQLATEVNSAVDGAAAGSSDPVIEVTSHATGHWSASPPSAHATAQILAVDAIPVLNTDVPVAIYANTEFRTDLVLNRVILRTTISWAAHDFITTLSGGAIEVVEDKVSDAVLDKLHPPPGQVEVGRGDRHVIYEGDRPLAEPKTSLFTTTVDHASVDGSGLSATGRVTVFPPPVAHFTLEEAHYESGIDCHARQWRTTFHPPAVHIFGVDRFVSLFFRATPTVAPPDAWVPSVSWSGFGPGNQIAHVTFASPPGGPKTPGSRASGFIDTTMGVRWVDLGAVPVRPAPPADPIGIQVHVISTCMAISDRWGMGVFNLDWLVDPPDLDLGMPQLREWTISGIDLVDVKRIELRAIGPAGERSLALVPVTRGAMLAQVITDADEVVQVRGSASLSASPPQVMQRWIVPWSAIATATSALSVALHDDAVFVADTDGVSRFELPALPTAMRAAKGAARWRRLDTSAISLQLSRKLYRGGKNSHVSVPRTAARGRAVAVLHRGSVILGFAGPLVAVPDPIGRTGG